VGRALGREASFSGPLPPPWDGVKRASVSSVAEREGFNSEHAKFSNNNGKINRYLLKFKDFNIRLMGSFCQYHWQNKNRRNRKHGRQGKSMVLAKP
jgi:hypothetical protein